MIREFEIFIPDEKIELLNQKIDLTRWPDEINDARWSLGAKKSYIQEAMTTWRNNFDWRKHEAKLNEAGTFTKITQRIRVRIDVEQEQEALKPGMMVEVFIDPKE